MDVDVLALKKTTFAHVAHDNAFFVCRGDRVDNIRDLANCIESLSSAEFKHHVDLNGKRNDFAVWIQDVLKNPLLAKDLNYEINLSNQVHFVKTIRDHVRWLEAA
jgi:hypothetical protein